MELGLSLGDAPKFLKNKGQKQQESGMNMALSLNSCAVENQGKDEDEISEEDGCSKFNLPQNPLHLNLLPLSPRRRPCFSHNGIWESGGGSSDDDDGDNVNTAARNRKKLRLSKQQSAFLEQSFKEHHTLNHKKKLALAKHLNLRHRQVEVWFQNRRARTKVKQTEVDCEYLKRCCDTLSEENRRLHKELQELRALKTSNPFYMQMPATTLTMCLSCAAAAATAAVEALPLNRSKFHPFSQTPNTTRNMHIDNGSGP